MSKANVFPFCTAAVNRRGGAARIRFADSAVRVIGLCLLTPLLAAAGLAAENAVVLDIEPTKEFPRNSEGAFVTLKSGRILFCYTQFYGGARDESPARIVAIQSDDGGRTWSRAARVVVENRGGANVMSVSLLRLRSGRIALFYLLKNSWIDCRPHVQFSDDEAQTWSEPLLMCAAPGYFVMNNDRVIQLAGGRLVAPLASHRTRGTDPQSSRSFDSRAVAVWLLSDDEGRTWREADTWVALPVVPSRTGLQEPGVVERADGKILGWFRTDRGAQFMNFSSDGGKTWTLPSVSEMQSPTSPASIKRLPESADLLAVWNDHSGRFPMVKGRRTPLVAGISTDGGQTWPHRKLLEDDPDGWYCYTAMHYVDGAVLLAYCAGDSKVGGLNRLRIRRVELGWLRGN
jgi:hypothetical protein